VLVGYELGMMGKCGAQVLWPSGWPATLQAGPATCSLSGPTGERFGLAEGLVMTQHSTAPGSTPRFPPMLGCRPALLRLSAPGAGCCRGHAGHCEHHRRREQAQVGGQSYILTGSVQLLLSGGSAGKGAGHGRAAGMRWEHTRGRWWYLAGMPWHLGCLCLCHPAASQMHPYPARLAGPIFRPAGRRRGTSTTAGPSGSSTSGTWRKSSRLFTASARISLWSQQQRPLPLPPPLPPLPASAASASEQQWPAVGGWSQLSAASTLAGAALCSRLL